ncbi:hypothetical protein ACFVZH_02750 [Streptomyces sp. NPDC059534]|uniref:VG15 protein n=1 Tax=Streptomyces sp. NPDC059534 TaxID=3346859 RepID=UPI0036B47D40
MATTVSDVSPAAVRDRAAHALLTRLLMRDMRRLQRLIVPDRLEESLSLWRTAVSALIGRYGTASASLSAESYDRQRRAAGAPGSFSAQPASEAPDEQVEQSLRWATADLWPTDEEQEAFDVRLAAAQARAESAAQRLVANQGRATMRESADRDRGAVAYARAAALGACYFCKLMASRGAVYKSAGTAGRNANEQFSGDESVVKFHNDCHCTIIPVFRGQQFQLSEHAAGWDRLYRKYAQGHPGDQLRLFRRALAEHDSNPLPGSN